MTFLTKFPIDPFDWPTVTDLNLFSQKTLQLLKFKDSKATLELDLPGVTKESVRISLENQQLVVNWTRKGEKYTHAWSLQKEVDESKSTATLKDGVLTVVLHETTRHQRTIRVD